MLINKGNQVKHNQWPFICSLMSLCRSHAWLTSWLWSRFFIFELIWISFWVFIIFIDINLIHINSFYLYLANLIFFFSNVKSTLFSIVSFSSTDTSNKAEKQKKVKNYMKCNYESPNNPKTSLREIRWDKVNIIVRS